MNFFIPKNAPDTEEAYEFLNYILEPEVAANALTLWATTVQIKQQMTW